MTLPSIKKVGLPLKVPTHLPFHFEIEVKVIYYKFRRLSSVNCKLLKQLSEGLLFINYGFFVFRFLVTFYTIKKASAAEKQSSTVIVKHMYYAFSGYLSWGTEKA